MSLLDLVGGRVLATRWVVRPKGREWAVERQDDVLTCTGERMTVGEFVSVHYTRGEAYEAMERLREEHRENSNQPTTTERRTEQ